MVSFREITAIVLGVSILGSWAITQSFIVATIVGTIWAIVGVGVGFSKIPKRDSIGRWRDRQTGHPITETRAGTAIASAVFGPAIFYAFHGPNLSQVMPWLVNLTPEIQIPYFLGTSGLGFVLSR